MGDHPFQSRNPSTPEKPTCNHHCYSEILLSFSVIFSFQVFHVRFCVFAVAFYDLILLTFYFDAWIDFLGIYPQHLVLSLRY